MYIPIHIYNYVELESTLVFPKCSLLLLVRRNSNHVSEPESFQAILACGAFAGKNARVRMPVFSRLTVCQRTR